MIVRSKTLLGWLKANFKKDQLRDMAEQGCVMGYAGLTWFTDTSKLYDRFEEEIWEIVMEYADNTGEGFPGFVSVLSSPPETGYQFKNALVWFACEEYARRLTENPEE